LEFKKISINQDHRLEETIGNHCRSILKPTAMKKNLLLITFLFSVNLITAQQKLNPKGTSTSSVCNVIPIGHAPNAFGSSGGNQRQISYDKDINTVAFIHRSLCDTSPTVIANIGFNYDISSNGGTTWNSDQHNIYGPVSNPTPGCSGSGPHPSRFPKGMIYNITGNTNPLNAHLSYVGMKSDFTGKVNGTGHFDNSAPNENYDPATVGNSIFVQDIFVTKTNVSWVVGTLVDANIQYADTILILKGAWNGSDFVYTTSPVRYFVNPLVPIRKMKVAFSDNGLIGYIAIMTNQDTGHIHFTDSCAYIQVLKTEDGGQTWNCPIDLDVSTCLDSALIGLGINNYSAANEMDIAVDKNNNPHIFASITGPQGAGTVYLQYPYGNFGVFDFYSNDQGTTWQAQLIAHPQTYLGQWGTSGVDQISEFQRPFISRTWDGSKIYFGYFDTDTATYFIYANLSPDLRLIGYDVDNNTWTAPLDNLQAIDGGENITAGTTADGACTLAQGSYYAKDDGINFSVPVCYTVMGITPSDPVAFYYIDCAAPSGAFIYNGHPLSVPVLHLSPVCIDGDGVVLTTNDLSKDLLVSSNYPNPFTGKTSVDVTLAKAGDVTIEIRNVIGQKLSSSTYKNLKSGLNTITINASSLTDGLYFFTVTGGNISFTRKMMVE
jgi:hypothetical protein